MTNMLLGQGKLDMSRQVLVVDDDEDIATAVETVLKMENYDVVTAHNGTDAVKDAQEFHPTLIVLDLMLPDMDGTEVAKRIRGRYGVDPAIVLLSASSEIHKACSDIGAQACIQKPFNVSELLSTVGQYVH